jgi:DNA-binding phage protein
MARLQTTEETRRKVMALTRDFKETVRARVQRDPAFRRELLREGVESFLAGDVEAGKSVLRDYINATIGFHELAEITHHSPKSLMRMLSPSGNPHARNLFKIVSCLQKKAGVHFELKAAAAAAGR